MALAGDQNDVAFPGGMDGNADRFGAINHGLVPRAAHAGFDVLENGFGLFATRVIGGQDAGVAQLGRRLTHQRALGLVAIPAAAEDRDETVRLQLLDGAADILQSIRSVGVIDEHRDPVTGTTEFHPAGDLRGVGERRHGIAKRNLQRAGGGKRGERVVHVEAADERRADEIVLPLRGEFELHAAGVLLEVVRAEVAVDIEAVANDRQAVA